MERFSSNQIQDWLRDNCFEDSIMTELAKFDGKAMLNATEAGIMSIVRGAEGVRLYALLRREENKNKNVIKHRQSLQVSDSIFAIAVVTEHGVQLSGNCFAIGSLRIVTAFHNMYDILSPCEVAAFAGQDDELHVLLTQNDSHLQVFKYGIISQRIIHDGKIINTYCEARLVKYITGSVVEDWAIYELVSGTEEFKGCPVQSNPMPMIPLEVCRTVPVARAGAGAGADPLRAVFFDVGFYSHSSDPEEELICQQQDRRNVTQFITLSKTVRVQGGLNRGCSGCPYINNEGLVVALHLASLDANATRERASRFCAGITSTARDKYMSRKLEKFLASEAAVSGEASVGIDTSKQIHELDKEQMTQYCKTASYKVGFVLMTSASLLHYASGGHLVAKEED